MYLCEHLKNARITKGISLSKLSELTGIAKSTLQRYETGTTSKIPLDAIQIIENALGLDQGTLSHKNFSQFKRTSSFSQRLSFYRKTNNFTLEELGEKVNLPAQTICRYELGQRVPNVDIVNNIANSLNINPLWLQGYNVESLPDTDEYAKTKDFLKSRRKELHLTLKEVADYVGVSEATVCRWESGNIASMKHNKVKLLSEILCVSPLTITNPGDHNISDKEMKLLVAYRNQLDMQRAVDRLLGIEEKE